MTYMNNILSEDLIVGTRLVRATRPASAHTMKASWRQSWAIWTNCVSRKTMVFHGLHAKHYVTSSCDKNEWRLDTT